MTESKDDKDKKKEDLAVEILERLRSMPHHESIGYPEVQIYSSIVTLNEKKRADTIQKADAEIQRLVVTEADRNIPTWAYMFAMIDTVLVLYATLVATATGGDGKEILDIMDSHIETLKKEAEGRKKDGEEQIAYR